MSDFIFAAQQGRKIPKEDKNFAVNNRAKAMIAEKGKDAVVNATIGVLLDEEGKFVVLSSVNEVFKTLEAGEFAEYAPIGGIPGYKAAVLKDTFGSYEPKRHTVAVATPGGTGAIHSTIANYSEPGDKVLLTDWYWGPYGTIAGEIGRSLHTFKLVNEQGRFNTEDFEKQVMALLEVQDRLVIILNTPAHNPTGYSLTVDEWEEVASVLDRVPEEKKVTLLVDVAYLDFAGEAEEYRAFLPVLDSMGENILPVIAYSFSKSFTLYGMRCGAMICMAETEEIADEFRKVCEYSARAAWSNCTRAPQVMLSKIYENPDLLARIQEERAGFRDMLLRRGKAFEAAAKEAGLEIVPFDAGFFASVPCENPDAVGAELEKEGIFTIPLTMGVRISIASITEADCRRLPARILAAIEKVNK
ncbi:MAG: aminotransferase class I/II-fold pyridoxal phosphate-dependent enzyme [Firmicutes bacterium]|nr:aminotransferase class I/II-fold pyridoxal phosphate-dependent enzyme [Bacillota bacterium]